MIITDIEYDEGGHFGEPRGFHIDVANREFRLTMCTPFFEVRFEASGQDAARFDELVKACDFLSWRDRYEIHACDGTQWSLQVKSGDRVIREISGSNDWPVEWKSVLALLDFCQCPVSFDYGDEEDDMRDDK